MDTVKILDKEYPVRITMGAMREFRKLSGKEVEQISGSSDVGEFLFACALSTCRAQGTAFDLSVETFTDNLDFMHANEVFYKLLEGSGYNVQSTAALQTDGKKKKGRA
jgi:hypothetical protein